MKKFKFGEKKSVEKKIDELLNVEPPVFNYYVDPDDKDMLEREMIIYETRCAGRESEAKVLKDLSEADQNLKKSKLNPDTILSVMASIASMVLILNFEKTDILRSKAVQFMPKIKFFK